MQLKWKAKQILVRAEAKGRRFSFLEETKEPFRVDSPGPWGCLQSLYHPEGKLCLLSLTTAFCGRFSKILSCGFSHRFGQLTQLIFNLSVGLKMTYFQNTKQMQKLLNYPLLSIQEG